MSNQGHCRRWGLFNEPHFLVFIRFLPVSPREMAVWVTPVSDSWWFGQLSWLLRVICDSLDLLQFSLYCLKVRCGKTLLYIEFLLGQKEMTLHCDTARTIVPPTCPITLLTLAWKLTSDRRDICAFLLNGVHTFAFKITWTSTYLILWLIREQWYGAFLPCLALSQ